MENQCSCIVMLCTLREGEEVLKDRVHALAIHKKVDHFRVHEFCSYILRLTLNTKFFLKIRFSTSKTTIRLSMHSFFSSCSFRVSLSFYLQQASHRYWPKFQGSTETYGDFSVTQETFDAYGDYVIRKLGVSMTSSEASPSEPPTTVTQFHFTHWTEKDHPQNCTSILDVIQEVNSVQMATGNKPIVVMCK